MASYLCTMASRSLTKKILNAQLLQPAARYHGREMIGKREVVGYGINGDYIYIDRCDLPMPAIRFREETADILKLREKEKGDWKNLTLEEKKKCKFFVSFIISFCVQLTMCFYFNICTILLQLTEPLSTKAQG